MARSIAEIAADTASGKITAKQAEAEIEALSNGSGEITLSTSENTGCCIIKMAGRGYPLASLYKPQVRAILANSERILAYIDDPANGVTDKNKNKK